MKLFNNYKYNNLKIITYKCSFINNENNIKRAIRF